MILHRWMLTVVVTVVICVVARRAITPGGFVAIAARITVLPANLNHWVVKVVGVVVGVLKPRATRATRATECPGNRVCCNFWAIYC